MEQSHSSKTDPPEIRTRLESIQRQRALIDDLATSLKAAQLEYDRMERELKEYRYFTALNKCPGPVQKCPVEVLLMIFELFVVDAPELVASLLQVCKRWREIAADAPRLWTHINIKIEPTWDQRTASKDHAMIETYLEHSASLPLHINVDVSQMLSEASQTQRYLGGLTLTECDTDIRSHVRGFLSSEWEGHPLPVFGEPYGPHKVLDTIEELAGSNGEHMHRWKTLRIFFPNNDWDIEEIWKLFSARTPQLTELLISADMSQLSRASQVSQKNSFPDLSSLESLTLWGKVNTDINFLGLTFPSVKRLDLEINLSCCSQISLFTSLEYLDVLFLPPQVTDAVICLPLLRGLTIHLRASITVKWDVPVLQRLEIVAPYMGLVKTLPNVQALEVAWKLPKTSYVAKDERKLLLTLEAIMSQYRDMQKLTIQALLRPIWENYAQQLGEEKRLVLPTITFD